MHLLFVCTGNTCRSPLAEAIARRLIADRAIPDLTVGSAGTSAWPDAPASDGAMLVALEHGIDIGEHRARALGSELVEGSRLILAMGPHHLYRVEALGGGGRSWLLTEYAGGPPRPVSDPFGGDLAVYRATYAELEHEIRAILDRIVAERGRLAP
ncbi:MAG: low molecular weight protein arginine phosphatase [Gemmatimonadota bacterium]|nr:low molecular weight protein arginine phosphatase [Gemmatimonadota bacterium]